jgi:peptide/nickel transport system permease protein
LEEKKMLRNLFQSGQNGRILTIPVKVCLGLLVIILLGAVIGPHVVSFEPNEPNMAEILQRPSAAHWLGTDNLGRDQFTRLLYGGRTTLLNALMAVGISVIVGVPFGLLCGYFGGKLDMIVMRIWDFILCFPALFLAFILVATFGRGSFIAVIAIGIIYIPMISKLTRSITLTERVKPYVEACATFGYSTGRILFGHILPNCVPTLLAELTFDIGMAIMSLASLSFLGLGVKLPQSDWGAMLQEGVSIIMKAPYLVAGPTIVIILTIVSLNVVSDGIQMYLDPEQQKLPSFEKYRAQLERRSRRVAKEAV